MSPNNDLDVTGALRKERYVKDSEVLFEEACKTKLPLALLIVDLDNFKKVNDKLGHQGADEILKILAGTMNRNVGHRGRVYRYGGDEFTVILPNHTLDEGAAIAYRLHSEISGLTRFREIGVTTTIGVAAWPLPVQDIHKVFEAADRLLLDGKNNDQKNTVHVAKTDANPNSCEKQWRFRLLFSPEKPLNIPKHQLLDQLIAASYSQPLDRFGRRYCFPLLYDRSNLLQDQDMGWIGAVVEDSFADEVKYEICSDGSARLTMIGNYDQVFRAVKGDNLLLESIRFWPFTSRYWAKSSSQRHYMTFHLEGIKNALLSLHISTFPAVNLISKTNSYKNQKIPFLAAKVLEGAEELLSQTCHNIISAFEPPRGVSRNDMNLEYFLHKAKDYLADVRDHDPREE